MSVVTDTTPTQHAKKYVKRLSKHWSHTLEVGQLDDYCEITLPLGLMELMPASDQAEIRRHPEK